MKKTILVLLIFLVNVSFSQRRYVPGYLYTANNDSISGKIKDKLFFSSPGKKIKFITADGTKKKYKAKNLYGYTLLGLMKYLSIPASTFGGSLRFMQVIEDGDLILLSYTRTTSTGGSYVGSSYGGTGGGVYRGGGTTTTTRYYIMKKGNKDKTGRIPFIGFKNFMLSYVNDDAEMKKLVEEKSLTFMDTQLIVKKYNDNKRKNKG